MLAAMPRVQDTVQQLNPFYSAFGSWLGQVRAPARARVQFMTALRRATEIELPLRDSGYEVVVRDLTDTAGLTIEYRDHHRYLFSTADDRLAVATVCPNWSRGWSNVSRDEDVAGQIGWFFHHARQYILRSSQASVLAALAVVYKRAPDFRGKWLESAARDYAVDDPNDVMGEIVDRKRHHFPSRRQAGRYRVLQQWMGTVNGFDPFIHRAVFQYVRARKLTAALFEEESVTALDGLGSVAAQFATVRLGSPVRSRRELASVLGLPRRDGLVLEHLYNLRCDFGAHPGRSKWWDFGEIYEDVFSGFFDTAERLLYALARAENAHRAVSIEPTPWSHWFADNAAIVYEAVWSHRLR